MENAAAPSRHWCHVCSRMVYIATGVDLQCPYCHNGFIEEISNNDQETNSDVNLGSDRILSVWAPILLGVMNNTRRRSPFDSDEQNSDNGNDAGLRSYPGSGSDRAGMLLQLLEGVRAGLSNGGTDSDRNGDGDTDRGVAIEPFNRTVILRGPVVNSSLVDFLGDYFMGRGLDLVLQHLAEADPNRQVTHPTRKEVIEALPTIEIKENSQCSVCLDDFEVGKDAKEMPCKHMFHENCILPWLEVHSTCPVCRYQLPVDEPKLDLGGNVNAGSGNRGANNGEGEGRVWNRRRFSLPWLISGLFGNTTSSSSSTSRTVGNRTSNPTDGN